MEGLAGEATGSGEIYCLSSNMESNGWAGYAFFFSGFKMEDSGGFGNPFVAGDKEFPFGLAFGDEEAIEADVIDIDAVGEIAASIVFAEGDSVFEVVAFDEDLGGNGFSRADGDLLGFDADLEFGWI